MAAGYLHWKLHVSRILAQSDDIPKATNCLPSIEQRLRPAIMLTYDSQTKLKEALRLTKKLRPEGSKVRVVTADESDQERLHLGAITDGEKNEVLILSNYVDEASLEQIVRTLILHFVARPVDIRQAATISKMPWPRNWPTSSPRNAKR